MAPRAPAIKFDGVWKGRAAHLLTSPFPLLRKEGDFVIPLLAKEGEGEVGLGRRQSSPYTLFARMSASELLPQMMLSFQTAEPQMMLLPQMMLSVVGAMYSPQITFRLPTPVIPQITLEPQVMLSRSTCT